MTRLDRADLTELVAWLRLRLARGAGGGETAANREIVQVMAGLKALAAEPQVPAATAAAHPATRHLPAALAELAARPAAALLSGQAGPLGDLLQRVGAALPWRYSYAPRPEAPALEHNMAWAELVGPGAPFASERVCLGLLLIGPQRYYPPHAHPAVELYDVLAGAAAWMLTDGDGVHTAIRPPGSLVLHPSGAVHAMRTGARPLLALYTWTGDLNTAAAFTVPAAD